MTFLDSLDSCTLTIFFSQVVIERPSLRPDSKGTSKEAEEDVVMLYIVQLAALAVLLTAM